MMYDNSPTLGGGWDSLIAICCPERFMFRQEKGHKEYIYKEYIFIISLKHKIVLHMYFMVLRFLGGLKRFSAALKSNEMDFPIDYLILSLSMA